MDREKLEKMVNKKQKDKEKHYSLEKERNIMQGIHAYHQKHFVMEDVLVAVEEMAELTQVLSKIMRKKMSTEDIGILEEIVDVMLATDEAVLYVFDIKEETLQENKTYYATKDLSKTKDCIMLLIKRMTRCQSLLCEAIKCKGIVSNSKKSKLAKAIAKVQVSIDEFINYYDIDKERLKYIKDVKLERGKERIKKGE